MHGDDNNFRRFTTQKPLLAAGNVRTLVGSTAGLIKPGGRRIARHADAVPACLQPARRATLPSRIWRAMR